MNALITTTTAKNVPLSRVLAGVNESYQDYFVPVNLSEKAFLSLLARESVILDHSPVAVVDGKVVGTVLLGKRGERGWIGGVGIIPAFRGLGIARRLMKEAITAAASLGLTRLQLEVVIENEAAIHLYESMGFEIERDLFIMSSEGGGNIRVREMPFTIRAFKPGRHSPSLDWIMEKTPIKLPWQREREALLTERRALQGLALVDDSSEELKGICLFQPAESDNDIKALVVADSAGGEYLLTRLLNQYPWTFTSCLNIPEDDPMVQSYRDMGFRIMLIQHEMHLQIG